MLEKRKLGNSDLYFTKLGFGTFALGGSGWQFSWGKQDDNESIKTIIHAVELGINWIDTAPAYGLGHAEEIVGKALKEISDKPYIASKCGRRWDKSGNVFNNLDKESITEELEDSLKRLNVEAIDLYQIHWPDPEEKLEEAWELLKTFQKAGKVRYIGICNVKIDHLKKLDLLGHITSIQSPYNLLNRAIENETIKFCYDKKIGITCYSPLFMGLLTGKFSEEYVKNLPDDDFRKRIPPFQNPMLAGALELVEQLKKIGREKSLTVAQLAIAWTLKRKEVTSAIIGARNCKQIDETIKSGMYDLSDEEYDMINLLIK